jgi:hypothetical protein
MNVSVFLIGLVGILGGAFSGGCTKKEEPASSKILKQNNDVKAKADLKMPPSVKIWDTLSLMEPELKEPPTEVKAILGTTFKVSGYPVINEASTDGVSDFLITPIPGGCVHVPPPPPGYIIHVTLPKGKKITLQSMYNAIRVRGTLSLNTKKEDKDFYAYEFKADLVEKYSDDE